MIKYALTIFIIFLAGSILAQEIDLFEEYDPAEDSLDETNSLIIREDLPEINFVVNNAFYMKALYPDYYIDDYRIQKDIRSVKKNDSALIATWDSLGVFVFAMLEQLSGVEWKEKIIDIHLVKYMRNRGLYDPLMIPFDGIKHPDYTEAAPTGILRLFNMIQLLAGRNLQQLSEPGQLDNFQALHPLLDQTAYRFDVLALTLALACAQQLLPPDSLDFIMQSESWKRHNPGWNIFENHFRYAWPLSYEQPLITFLALEDSQFSFLTLSKPPRIKKPKIKNRPKEKVTQLAAGGGRLGFSVSRNSRGYLRVVDIDTLGLAYASGLMIDDQIKRVNSEYARNARELMGIILERLDTEGVYRLVSRAGSEIGVLLLPALEEYDY